MEKVGMNGQGNATAIILTAMMIHLNTTPCIGHGNDQEAKNMELEMEFQDAETAAQWTTVNDNVMGGRSIGDFRIQDGSLVFTGSTNTNGGGFSSIRSKPLANKLLQSGSFRIRCKGDGRVYRFSVRTSARYYNVPVAYYASFETTKDEWIETSIPLKSFYPSVRGMDLSKVAPALNPGDIESIGIMIYDQKDGPFKLEVDWIRSDA